MLKLSALILTFWMVVNLTLALGILVWILALGNNAPALIILFGDTSAVGIEPRALSTVNALAVIFNSYVSAFCISALTLIWSRLIHRSRSALWSLAGSTLLLQSG